MVSWESKSDRGRCPPSRGHGHRSSHTAKPTTSREKTPTKEAAPSPAPAPRGSPISKKLAKHAPSWNMLTVPRMAVHVRPVLHSPPCLICSRIPSLPPGQTLSFIRPRYSAATSHRRLLVLRAGFPSHWVSRLTAPPTGRRYIPGTSPRYLQKVPRTRLTNSIPFQPTHVNTCQPIIHWLLPCALHPTYALVQEGETIMGLTHLNCCGENSYSGPIPLTPDIHVNAIHCNGRPPSLVTGSESTIWMMTRSTLTYPEDLKILIR